MRKPRRAAAPKPAPVKVNPGGPNKPAPSPQARTAARKRHLAAVKAAATRKKHAAAAKKKHVKPVRKLALGEAVACCSAEALAASLRLTGWPVSDADVLALYELTADGPDDGATIEATLEAAQRYGIAGLMPLYHPAQLVCEAVQPHGRVVVQPAGHYETAHAVGPAGGLAVIAGHNGRLVLGLQLAAGPHAVLADGDTWWSWGQPYDPADFPDAVIDEAWAVTWP